MKYMPGEATMRNWTRVLLIGLCLVVPVILLGCFGSLENDTGPSDPGGGTGNNPPGGGTASFNITVTAIPPTLVANGLDISLITVHVRNADTGRSVPNGTAVTMYTTLGALNTDGSITGDPRISVSVMNGMATAYLASGLRSGTAVVTATVGRSSGQVSVPIYDPPEE
jgi:hypothetical protein